MTTDYVKSSMDFPVDGAFARIICSLLEFYQSKLIICCYFFNHGVTRKLDYILVAIPNLLQFAYANKCCLNVANYGFNWNKVPHDVRELQI
ncbi:hypothetical protein TNCT_25701 [Trichonephila clavata]|uniref:Uncharacterized protein n=1 Tax=Trichonephila clavata TaxID=2740835 RepID=A0A8X6FRR7_TRICU|nr:hypothetical protein TNCT_25701 [Trichonephila clavata]